MKTSVFPFRHLFVKRAITRRSWPVFILSLALTSSALAQDAILIGVSLPLSGNLGTAGQLALEGIRVANRMRPTVLERPVELRVTDTRSEKAEEMDSVYRLTEKHRVSAVIGGILGNTGTGFIDAEKRVVPLVTPRAASSFLVCEKGFGLRTRLPDGDQAEHAANLALNGPGARTAAIVYDVSDEQSIALAASFERKFVKDGGKVLFQARIRTGHRDFTTHASQVRAAKPDIIYAPLHHVECALLARQVRNLDPDVTMIAGDAVHMEDLIEFGSKSVENLVFTSYFHESMIRTETGQTFRDLCTKQTGRQLQAAQAFGADAYFLVLDAIATAGSTAPTRIREALSSLTCFDGVTGRISIEKGSKTTRPVFITKVKDGRFVALETVSKIVRSPAVHGHAHCPSARSESAPFACPRARVP